MAADVSTLVRLLSRYDRGDGGGGGGGGEEVTTSKPDLVTRDLLGGCCVVGGGALLQSAGTKKAAFPDLHLLTPGETRVQSMDLNMPPLWSLAPRMTPLENSAPPLDLRLRSTAPAPAPPPPPAEYQSVCTLEKVKSALERAERDTRRRRRQRDPPPQPRRVSAGLASPTSSSTTTSSSKRRLGEGGVGVEEGEGESGPPLLAVEAGMARAGDGGSAADPAAEMAAAGCPSCLMYVLVSRSNPRCPRCSSAVPLPPPPPAEGKKPRIDLNASACSAPEPSSSPIRTVQFF